MGCAWRCQCWKVIGFQKIDVPLLVCRIHIAQIKSPVALGCFDQASFSMESVVCASLFILARWSQIHDRLPCFEPRNISSSNGSGFFGSIIKVIGRVIGIEDHTACTHPIPFSITQGFCDDFARFRVKGFECWNDIFIDRLLIGWFRFIHPMASIQRKIAQSSKAEVVCPLPNAFQ